MMGAALYCQAQSLQWRAVTGHMGTDVTLHLSVSASSLAAGIISHLTMLQQMQPLFNNKLSRSVKLKGHGWMHPFSISGQLM
jgi:hypothetical protein